MFSDKVVNEENGENEELFDSSFEINNWDELNNDPNNRNLLSEPAKLLVNISQGEFDLQMEVPIHTSEVEKSEFNNLNRTHRERTAKLDLHMGKVYSLILGQCSQLLQDKMKQDATWSSVICSYNPLELYNLMEKVILKQTEDQYAYSAVAEQIIAVYTKKQGNLLNAQWYEQFNTRVDVSKSVGVDFGHQVLWEYSANVKYRTDYNSLSTD